MDYATFAAIVLLGRAARGPARPGRIAALSISGSVALLPRLQFRGVGLRVRCTRRPPAGLVALLCGGDSVLLGDAWRPISWAAAALFSLDALSRHVPGRRAAAAGIVAACCALAASASAASAQQLPPASEDVVVTATSVPDDEKDVGSAVTVITREDIVKSETPVVSDLLRRVPGLDVVTLGSPGSQTSLFTRGTNSTQTLVLVDGARMNSPFFAGYDWAAADDGERRAHRDRARAVLGPLRLRRDRRCRPDLHAGAGAGPVGTGDRRGRQPGTGPRLRFALDRRGPLRRDRRATATRPSTATARTPTGASATARPASRRDSPKRATSPSRDRSWTGRSAIPGAVGSPFASPDRAGSHSRGTDRAARDVRAVRHEPARRAPGERSFEAGIPGRRVRVADGRADATRRASPTPRGSTIIS